MKIAFARVGLAKERESPENPGAMDKRVALTPQDAGRLVGAGCQVCVEAGAGEEVGFPDSEYLEAGAEVESRAEIYRNKDLVLKLKGPSMEAVALLKPGSTLMCMLHAHSFPQRLDLLQSRGINAIAMEEIVESPKRLCDEIILAKTAMRHALRTSRHQQLSLDIRFMGYSQRMAGAIRRASNRNPRSVQLLQPDVALDELEEIDSRCLFFCDSDDGRLDRRLPARLRAEGCAVFDLARFESERGKEEIARYRETHPPFEFGMRRIQCLHETGRAGARYGLQLLREASPKAIGPAQAEVCVLGYGNVGMGAIHECHAQGVRRIRILGRLHTQPGAIEPVLAEADLVINGAEQPTELRGRNFLIKREHAREVMREGTVVIDLVGGSESNRSAVENVVRCTFLDDPYYVEDGILFSALWGWPMLGFMRETAERYSSQIASVLLDQERLLYRGLRDLPPGLLRGLACGPFQRVETA